MSLAEVEEKLDGDIPSEVERGYWKEWQNIEQTLQPVLDTFYEVNGSLPSLSDLRDLDLYPAYRGANNHFDLGLSDLYARIYDKSTEKSKKMIEVELEVGEDLEDFLERRFQEGEDVKEVAEEIGVSRTGLEKWSKQLDVEREKNRKPDGYWEDYENVKNSLGPFIQEYFEKNQELPNQRELSQNCPSSAVSAVNQYHGNLLNLFRDVFGIEDDEKTKTMIEEQARLGEPIEEYLERKLVEEGVSLEEVSENFEVSEITLSNWLRNFDLSEQVSLNPTPSEPTKDKNELIQEVEDYANSYVEQHGELPTWGDFEDSEHSKAVQKLHTSYDLGIKDVYSRIFDVPADWTRLMMSKDLILDEDLESYLEEQVQMEKAKTEIAEDLDISASALTNWLDKLDLNYQPTSKRDFDPQDREKVKEKLEEELEDFEEAPGISNLPSALTNAIQNHHEGMRGYREILEDLGYETTHLRMPNGWWEDEEWVKEELDSIVDGNGRALTQKELANSGNTHIFRAAENYGGLRGLYESFGYEPPANQRPEGFWEDEERRHEMLEEVVEEVIEEKGRAPTKEEIKERRTGLMAAVFKHDGSYNQLLVEMGYSEDMKRVPRGFWKDFENVENVASPFIEDYWEENGELPTTEDLNEEFGSLSQALHRNHDMGVLDFIRHLYDKEEVKTRGMIETELELGEDLESLLQREVIKKGKSVRQTAKEYDVNYQSLNSWRKKLDVGKIETKKSSKDFEEILESEENIQEVIEVFGGNKSDLADILSVAYGEKVPQEVLEDLQVNSELPEYMGEFVEERPDIGKLTEVTAKLIPMDEEGVVREIFEAKARKYRHQELGPNPSEEEVEEFVEEIEQRLSEVGENE